MERMHYKKLITPMEQALLTGVTEEEFNWFKIGAMSMAMALGAVSEEEAEIITKGLYYPDGPRCDNCSEKEDCKTRNSLLKGRLEKAEKEGKVIDITSRL